MTTFALSLPLDRISPVRVPTRDLVLGGTDSLTLLVSIVDRDSPDALPIALTGGIGGPALSMFVWPDSRGCHGPNFGGWGSGWDYGWGGWPGGSGIGGVAGPGTVMWSATGTVYDTTTATFRLVVPPGTMGAWPRRCRWAIFFDSDSGGEAELLAEGHLHVRPMVSRPIAPLILLTDPLPPVLATIYIDGSPGSASGSLPGSVISPAYVLPIASPTVLGGIRTDGVKTMTDASGVLTTVATLG
jgi:hypothetical protein